MTRDGAALPALRLYDSYRKQKVPLETMVPGAVSIYLCGPTTYDAAHVGHAYSAICFDVIRRSLAWLGYRVLFVRNVTDVDDKIIKRSNETGEPPLELSARYADEYRRDMASFGVQMPDLEPLVSTHIPDIIALVERLISRGIAYEVDGDVYYQVERFPLYGRLSGQSIDELRSGARVEVDERKRSPVDFALWKSAKPGEPSWSSPWGAGRPGWHIECSAMVIRHLGESFDIHGGGKDLIFPHHENEIAQSQGAYGEGTFARYWLHNGFLNLAGEKMSKSLGNVFSCPQVAAAAGPEAMRMFAVSHHYRSPVNFEVASEEGPPARVVFRDLEAADRRLDYFYGTLRRLADFTDAEPGEVVPEAETLVPAAIEALCDDFNTPVVVAALGEAARAANKLLDEGKGIPKPVRRRSLARLARDLRDVGGALGILESEPARFLAARRDRLAARRGIDVDEVERLLGERAQARADRDFTRADEIRGALQTRGVDVLDTPGGADWRVAE
ncbi:MAG TPA: cysteine--tRNA ligase [Kofleriaceae bacterium]|nr:cysteine--tRNA ligase [Kofleriaceae bacterium]